MMKIRFLQNSGILQPQQNLRGVVFVEILNNPPEHRVELGPHPSARDRL